MSFNAASERALKPHGTTRGILRVLSSVKNERMEGNNSRTSEVLHLFPQSALPGVLIRQYQR